jgi:hypothetical protein
MSRSQAKGAFITVFFGVILLFVLMIILDYNERYLDVLYILSACVAVYIAGRFAIKSALRGSHRDRIRSDIQHIVKDVEQDK